MSIGERIKSARTIAGMNQRELASATGVSAMAISKYERDQDVPGSSVLIRLARALGVKVEYFFRPGAVTLSPPMYRHHQSLPALQEASILGHVQEWLERYLDIEALLKISPPNDLPKLHIQKYEGVEDAAMVLREQWHIGTAPIDGLIELCEDHGIKVGLIEGHKDFDALMLWANGTDPVIALRRDMPGDRQRFCLAHELGHLMLEPAKDLDVEKVCQRFAGAFLVPKRVVEHELGKMRHSLSIYELHLLKHKYGMSMQAWVYRAKDLGILPEEAARTFFKYVRQKGWHREEPGDALPPEGPQRFERLVMHALCEGIISETRAAELLNVSLSELRGGKVAGHGGFTVEMCS